MLAILITEILELDGLEDDKLLTIIPSLCSSIGTSDMFVSHIYISSFSRSDICVVLLLIRWIFSDENRKTKKLTVSCFAHVLSIGNYFFLLFTSINFHLIFRCFLLQIYLSLFLLPFLILGSWRKIWGKNNSFIVLRFLFWVFLIKHKTFSAYNDNYKFFHSFYPSLKGKTSRKTIIFTL